MSSPLARPGHRTRALLVGSLMLLVVSFAASARAATFYSQGSLAPNLVASWDSNRGGGGTAPADFTSGDVFVVQAGHAMTTSAAWSVSGTGSSVQVEAGGTLTATAAITLAPETTFQLDAGASYVHGNSAPYATTVLQGTEAFAATSLFTIVDSDTIGPAATFGNLTIDAPALAAPIQCGGGLVAILGDLTLVNTNGFALRLADSAPASLTVNVGGDLVVQGGTLDLASGTTATTLELGGDFTQSGGTVTATGAGPHAVVFTGGAPSVTLTASGTLVSTNLDWTVAAGKTLALATNFGAGSLVATGRAMTVNGTFRIGAGAFPGELGTWTYGAAGSLVFAGDFGLTGSHPFWPATNGPLNVDAQGGIDLQGVSRTVSGTFRTGGNVRGTALALDGTCRIDAGGFFTTAPVYGASSTLQYATGGTYGRGTEWSATSGPGYPAHVQVSGGTTLDMAANGGAGTARQCSGALTVDAGASLSLADHGNGAMTQPLTVLGDVTNAGTLELSGASGGDLRVGGQWTQGGTLVTNSRAVAFVGAAPQVISGGTTFDGLDVSGSAGVTLASAVTVNQALTLGAQKLTTGANVLTLGAAGSVSRTSGHVAGNLARVVPAGASTAQFDIGDATQYAPVTVDFASAATGGTLTASTAALGSPPATESGLSAAKYVARTWTLANTGITSPSYTATFGYADPADLVGGASPAALTTARNSGGVWSASGVSATTSGSVTTAAGQTAFSDFYAGEPACPVITLSPAAGALPGASTGNAYNQALAADPTDTYTFAVTSGTLPAGLTLSSGGVLSGTPTALGTASFTVTATGSGGCTGSAAYTLEVTCGTIAVAPGSLPDGAVNSAYAAAVSASGGTGPYTFAVTAGTLPPGLTLLADTLSGTPSAHGTYGFSVTATDANGCTGVQAYSLTITALASGTALAVTPASPTVHGESVTLTATVTTGATGTVTFMDGVTSLGSAPLSGGGSNEAVLVTSALAVGAHSLTAVYAGDAAYAGSSSAPAAHTVNTAATTTALASSPNPSVFGGSVTLTATVATVAPGAGTATGNVTFYDGPTPLGSAALDGGGVATLATSSLAIGVHSLTAEYAGDGEHAASTSPAASQTVEAPVSNVVDAGSPAACVTPSHPTATIPVDISRNDARGIRLFHVTFQLSGPLQLAGAPATAVTEGTYLSAVNPATSFLVTDLGGGAYAVDGTILGVPCGATAASGRLFDIAVASSGGSGAGAVTITGVTLRDCANADLTPATAGTAASVTVDPAPITIAAIADPQAVVEQSSLTITPSAGQTACATGPLTWAVSPALPAGASFNTATGEITWTPACGQAGSYGPFTLTASVTGGESGSSNMFAITVSHLAGTVAVTVADPQTVAEQAALTITPGLGTTACVNPGSIAWTIDPALPAGAALNPATGVIEWTPDCAAAQGGAGGVYGPFTLTATAGTGESGTAVFSIVVTDVPTSVAAATAVSAAQVTSGNGPGSTTGITVHFTAPPGATSFAVYRAPYGQYPEYDDDGGAAPATPGAYPPSAPWTLTPVTADGGVDVPPSRDYWYYVVYAFNDCGDVSPVSARTDGTLDYHLGDVTDSATPGTGDDVVNSADVSLLGSHYGLVGAAVTAYAYLDVGPTLDYSVAARPGTDNRIDFEDLVMFAINYQTVSAPQVAARPANGVAEDAVVLEVPGDAATTPTVTVQLMLHGTGKAQALTTQLAWDPAVVEPASFAPGALLDELGAVAFSAEPGRLDAAKLGVDGVGLAGVGHLATMTFRRLAPGDPRLRVASVEGRDAGNQKVGMTFSSVSHPVVPLVTSFERIAPNPVRSQASLSFGLARGGPVTLAIYSVDGRLVRELVRGTRDAGTYQVAWDGRDESGSPAAAGVYYARLVTPQGRFTRSLVYLK